MGVPRAMRWRATASLAAIMHSSTSEWAGVWPSRCMAATRSPAKVTTGSGEVASRAPRSMRRARRASASARARAMSASSPASPIPSPRMTASASA